MSELPVQPIGDFPIVGVEPGEGVPIVAVEPGEGVPTVAVEPGQGDPVDLRLPREEAEALLLAVDALRPLLERVRAEIAPEPEPEPEPVATLALPDHDDALRRATWLARESLREARTALDERRPTAEQLEQIAAP